MAAKNVAEYLESLPAERRAALERVRDVVNGALPRGYEEGIQYGMIGWWVPHSLYPAGYRAKPSEPLPFLGLASRSGHIALHVMALYGDPKLRAWFEGEWKKSGKKLDLGGGCVRFTSVDGVALDVVAAFVKRMPVDAYVRTYEAMLGGKKSAGGAGKKSAGSAGKGSAGSAGKRGAGTVGKKSAGKKSAGSAGKRGAGSAGRKSAGKRGAGTVGKKSAGSAGRKSAASAGRKSAASARKTSVGKKVARGAGKKSAA